MRVRRLAAAAGLISMSLSGCTTYQVETRWPEPRPLGEEFATYLAPSLDVPERKARRGADSLSNTELARAIDDTDVRVQTEEPTGDLTLREALSLALLRNPELAAFSWEVRAAEARTLQASLRLNPEVEFEIDEFRFSRGGSASSTTRTIGNGVLEVGRERESGAKSGLDEAIYTVGLSQVIELAGKRAKRTRVAALKRDLAAWDYETVRLDVLTEVAQTFVDVLGGQESLVLAEETVRVAEQVVDTASARVRAGKVPLLEETRARVELSSSRIEEERARRSLKAARNRLAAIWGAQEATFERVIGNLEEFSRIPSSGQLSHRISQNPDIARWVVEMEQRRAAVELEMARRIPNLTVTGGYNTTPRRSRRIRGSTIGLDGIQISEGSSRFDEADNDTFFVGFSIPLPLFDRNQGNLKEARYLVAKAEEERRDIEVRVRTALSDAYQRLATAYSEVTSLKDEILPGAEQAFNFAQEGYRQGKFGYLEVLDTQRTLFGTRSQYIEALVTYHLAVADVERLIGEPLLGEQDTYISKMEDQ